MSRWGAAKFSANYFPPPERFDRLELGISVRVDQPHFRIDPGWPYHGPEYEKQHHLPVGSPRLMAEAAKLTPRGTRLSLPRTSNLGPHKTPYQGKLDRRRQKLLALTVECPVCHAGRGNDCMLPFPLPFPHWERRMLARGITLVPDAPPQTVVWTLKLKRLKVRCS